MTDADCPRRRHSPSGRRTHCSVPAQARLRAASSTGGRPSRSLLPGIERGGRQTGRNEPQAPTLKHRAVGLPGAPKTEQRGGFILLGRRPPLAPQLLLEPELLVLLKLRLVPDVDTLAESGIRPRIVEATLPLVDQDPSLSQPLHVRQLLGGVRAPLLEAGGLEAFLVRLSIALSVRCTPGHGEHSGDNQDPHADRGRGSRLPPR